MNKKFPSPGELKAGEKILGAIHELGREEIQRYNRYVTGGKDTLNIHTDDETARRAGLPRAVATGRHPVSFISESLVDIFGSGFLTGGKIDVAFVKPIFPDDAVHVEITVREIRSEATGKRTLLDISLVNQDGILVTVGTASAWTKT